VLVKPGQYVAGAYPKGLAWIDEEMIRVRTLHRQPQIGYETAMHYARSQVGPLLSLAAKVERSTRSRVTESRTWGKRRPEHWQCATAISHVFGRA
jgi:DNA relaxase NicK